MTEPGERAGGGRFPRKGDGLEFDRLAFFTDAVFAIAMTLLVVGIAVPAISHQNSASSLVHALSDKLPEFIAFFIGFAMLGFYWAAHHRFFANLGAIDGGLLGISLVYLAFVAILPFPTALIGELDHNPVTVCIFAANAGAVSGLEALLLWRAQRERLLRRRLPGPVYRHAFRGAVLPVLFFVTSLPLAFVHTYLAIAWWFVTVPAESVLDRVKPSDFEEYFA